MRDSDMLAGLVAQAEGTGSDLVMIRALVEEASEIGAARALDRIGLSDRAAEKDMRELRELLSAWRDAKTTTKNALIGWIVRGCLALVLIGIVRLAAHLFVERENSVPAPAIVTALWRPWRRMRLR